MSHVGELLARDRADLSAAERARVDAHLPACPACRALEADLVETDRRLSRREPYMPLPPFANVARPRERALPLALGTVAALAILAVVVLAPIVGTLSERPAQPQPAGDVSPSPGTIASAAPTIVVTASPALTQSPAPTATPSPSPTPPGTYMSKKLGFALELPPPWRKASCGNMDPIEDGFPGVTAIMEQFTSASPMDERIGHTGGANDRIAVRSDRDPERRTPRQIAEDQFRGSPDVTFTDVTIAGRPAVEVQARSGEQFWHVIADGDRIVQVGYVTYRPASVPPADAVTMQRIVRSFRFLSTSERQALPDPTPIPAAAATPQALAGMLKAALEAKDVAALERLLGRCVSVGARQAGVSSVARQRYIAQLGSQLAAGLTVTVDASAIKTGDGFYETTVRSRWNAVPAGEVTPPPSPGAQTYAVDLVLGKTAGGWFWRGTLVTFAPPR